MADIGKFDALQLWLDTESGLLVRLGNALRQQGAHPARSVVLLPYAQLRPLANRLWAQAFPDGFVPRFETTMSWASALAEGGADAVSIQMDVAADLPTAQYLLRKAGLATQSEALAGLLVQTAQQLAPIAAACIPEQRSAWAEQHRRGTLASLEGAALAWEAAVARIALEWAAATSYPSDILFSPGVRDATDALILVNGFSQDPMVAGLQSAWTDKLVVMNVLHECHATSQLAMPALHACRDAEDEAQRAAASVLRHIEAGHAPVALVSSDRSLTRRVRAMLDAEGVQIRDENGWKLSTTASAARVMALLRAVVWNASTDRVLDWLKSSAHWLTTLDSLESLARQAQARDWSDVRRIPKLAEQPEVMQDLDAVEAMRNQFTGRRTLAQWLQLLEKVLRSSQAWDALEADAAGTETLSSLRMGAAVKAGWMQHMEGSLWGGHKLDLAGFTAWVNQTLESASFQPEYPLNEQAVILPMSQMLARPFGAAVIAGCDEVRLSVSPEPSGMWTAAQRLALGLPSRETLAEEMRRAWSHALQAPHCDVLWRTSDEAGEALQPSSLVQLLQLDAQRQGQSVTFAPDPREDRAVASVPVSTPLPTGALLPIRQLSQGAYEDLRNCPYKFFSLRQLGLKETEELESEIDKRDFGLWLHAVLAHFHAALASSPTAERAARIAMMEVASQIATESLALPDGEFLPFFAAWPAVRDGYLDWLEKHEATGAVFAKGEASQQQDLGTIKLIGRIDRLDTLTDGSVLVLDYKTEAQGKTKARVKDPLEDTQMAFYAALLPNDTLQAAYVNVGERDGTSIVSQPHIVEARDALVEGILTDMRHIAEGAALPALGEAAACEYCQARGLCRKDFWSAA
ncbi:MAG: PD-(D/E)XK nuclease family protein [Rhodoferax sp.]|nr:PD-(D/E)XK nuclease family protein [Rhodoferax sp.]